MTKLTESLSFVALFASIWLSVVLGLTPIKINDNLLVHVWLIPLYSVVMFGAISAAIVLYRVLTFNDCPQAYEELSKQIIEAKLDLTNKGIVFEEIQQ